LVDRSPKLRREGLCRWPKVRCLRRVKKEIVLSLDGSEGGEKGERGVKKSVNHQTESVDGGDEKGGLKTEEISIKRVV